MNYLDLTNNEKAQDMIKTICTKTNCTEKEAIEKSINYKTCCKLLMKGYGIEAINMWKHDNDIIKYQKLETPLIEYNLTKEQEDLINFAIKIKILQAENEMNQYFDLKEFTNSIQNATKDNIILEFIIFYLQELGYHI